MLGVAVLLQTGALYGTTNVWPEKLQINIERLNRRCKMKTVMGTNTGRMVLRY